MADNTTPSSVHLDGASVNAILAAFVNKPGELEVRFVDGEFLCQAAGLSVTVTEIAVGPDGVDVRFQMAGETQAKSGD